VHNPHICLPEQHTVPVVNDAWDALSAKYQQLDVDNFLRYI